MSRVAGTTLTVLALLQLSSISIVDANTFLKANSHLKAERISEEDVQTTLLAEVEGTFGEGSASSRVKQLQAILGPIYAALPKNEKGFLGHATVRYALHRLFVQRHGWSIKGLDTAGGHRNSTSSAGLLKEQVPSYLQDLFEKRLAGRGFGLHELGVLAATIEHLVHSEAIQRLGNAFKVHSFMPTSIMSEIEADEVLDTYMTSFILGEDLSVMNLSEATELKQEMPELYMAWNDTQEFVRATRQNIMKSEASAEQKSSGGLDFSLAARVAERVGERFGTFQDQECKQMKDSLVKIEDSGTGRVLLSEFYKPGLDGQWQFQESMSYLRQLGALDESTSRPSVIIANYISSPSNCIASSSFYSVCCMDECEGLLGHLEQRIAAPMTTSSHIANLVSELSSSSVVAPRQLSSALLDRLGEIAAEHGGTVPLHGRLFAQWMHHAFPRECPYPHLSGATNPQTPDEWLESTGEETTATEEEMQGHVKEARKSPTNSNGSSLPWSPEEELLVARPAMQSDRAVTRNAIMFMVMTSIAFGMVRNAFMPRAATSKVGGCCEKYLV